MRNGINLDNMSLISIRNLSAGYVKGYDVFDGLSIDIPMVNIVTILGANGAGKSTLIRILSGQLNGVKGDVYYKGIDIANKSSYYISKKRILLCPDGKKIFKNLSVKENLMIGNYKKWLYQTYKTHRYEYIYELFPVIRDKLNIKAGYLSGGEQQMLAISRSILMEPELLLLDEPSMGLSPIMVQNLYNKFIDISRLGITLIIAEQNVGNALRISDYVVVVSHGKVLAFGQSNQFEAKELIRMYY